MSLITRNISLKIDNKTLLDDINIKVKAGEFVAILGPNGAGKSSLFKVITREFAFFDGEVELNGKNYSKWSAQDIALQMGVLPQSSGLNFPFTAFDVAMLGRLPHSTGHTRDQEIALAALDKVDASHLANNLYPSLSGGEKQRVQLARVLAQIWQENALQTDRFLLLDEPTSALDLAHQHLTLQLAKQLSQQGLGVIAIVHDLNLASEYADRIIMLKDGRIAAKGNIIESLTPTIIKQVFDIAVSVIEHPQTGKPLVVNAIKR